MVCRAHVPGFRPRGDLALVGVDTTGRASVVRVVPGQSSPCQRGGATERWGKRGYRELDSNNPSVTPALARAKAWEYNIGGVLLIVSPDLEGAGGWKDRVPCWNGAS